MEVGPRDARLNLTPAAAVEVHPDRRPMNRAAGRCMGTLERLGIDRSWMCTPEWQPFKWSAKMNHKSEKFERPRLLVTWTETHGYVFQEPIVKELLPTQTAAGLVDVLSSRS